MTQYEQENDLGRGGGEVDRETMEKAWRDADARRGADDPENEEGAEEQPQPWAKLSSGDAGEA